MWKALSIGPLVVAISFILEGCSVFGSKAAEEPVYQIVERDGDFQIREYEAYAVAETTVNASFDKAVSEGFGRLFSYISGANRKSAKIDMTAPVMTKPESEKIAMTAPVMIQPNDRVSDLAVPSMTPDGDQAWTISFVLPEGVDAASAPAPTDPEISIRDNLARRVASMQFSGRFKNETAETKRQALAQWLAERSIEHWDDWQLAGYNPPWTIPALRRNEVLVTLR